MTWRTAAATPFVLLGDDVAGAECAVAISTRWSFAMNQYLQEHGHTDSFITCST